MNWANGLGCTVMVWVVVSVQGNVLDPASTTNCNWYVVSSVYEVLINVWLNVVAVVACNTPSINQEWVKPDGVLKLAILAWKGWQPTKSKVS